MRPEMAGKDLPTKNVDGTNTFFYKDKSGVWQGPWTAAQMQMWYRRGYLDNTVNIRVFNKERTTLEDLVQRFGRAQPFRDSPSDAPLERISLDELEERVAALEERTEKLVKSFEEERAIRQALQQSFEELSDKLASERVKAVLEARALEAAEDEKKKKEQKSIGVGPDSKESSSSASPKANEVEPPRVAFTPPRGVLQPAPFFRPPPFPMMQRTPPPFYRAPLQGPFQLVTMRPPPPALSRSFSSFGQQNARDAANTSILAQIVENANPESRKQMLIRQIERCCKNVKINAAEVATELLKKDDLSELTMLLSDQSALRMEVEAERSRLQNPFYRPRFF